MARFLWNIYKIDRGASCPFITAVNFYRWFRFVLFKLQWPYLQWFNILVVYKGANIQVGNRAHCPGGLFF